MAKKEKKKTPIGFLYVVIGIMVLVFVAQMVFPTNLGKVYDECDDDVVNLTVTVDNGDEEGKSYSTESHDEIAAFGTWASNQTMRNRSLADGISADSKNITEYNFAFEHSDGSYSAIVVDEKGYVHFGAELYKVSGNVDEFLADMVEQLEGWGASEEE